MDMPDVAHSAALRVQAATPGPLRILVVEDDPSYVTFLERLFDAAGIPGPDIERVERLAHILPKLQRTRIDAILLDLGLPDGDGLSWMRANSANLHVPIIVL